MIAETTDREDDKIYGLQREHPPSMLEFDSTCCEGIDGRTEYVEQDAEHCSLRSLLASLPIFTWQV